MKLGGKFARKMRKIIFVIITFFILVFIIVGIYLNQITKWNKNRIQNGEIKKLTLLENIEKDKYDVIIVHLPEDEFVKNYYYEIIYNVRTNDGNEIIMAFNEYEKVKTLSETNGLEINRIEYNVVYHKLLNNSYKILWKEYFKKCFTLAFNNKNEIIEKYLWENRYK
jgi:hypothetical protein